ncbi:hypothetical protein QEG73_21905 [Chitinophagaceae bacterium 26-R-25]|nr:hypothetical protein [Chitinophagaceae bacterium 26-R-25]
MNIEKVNTEFVKLLNTDKAARRKRRGIGMDYRAAASFRYKLRNNIFVSLELKLKWLQKAGVFVQSTDNYSKGDLVSLLNYYINKATESSKEIGVEYVVEKWMQLKR